jgi:hypothetical protein
MIKKERRTVAKSRQKRKLNTKQAMRKMKQLQEETDGTQLSNDSKYHEVELKLKGAVALVKKEGIS